MAHTDNLSIGVFIDGGYFAKINEGFRATGKSLNVDVKGLFNFIPEILGKNFGIDRRTLYITEAHYYRGRYRAKDADDRNLLFNESIGQSLGGDTLHGFGTNIVTHNESLQN